jgi:hypothetical protein
MYVDCGIAAVAQDMSRMWSWLVQRVSRKAPSNRDVDKLLDECLKEAPVGEPGVLCWPAVAVKLWHMHG